MTTTNKIIRLIENSSTGTPGIIAYLSNECNEKSFQFSTKQIITMLTNNSNNNNKLIRYIDEALESDLFTISDSTVIEEVIIILLLLLLLLLSILLLNSKQTKTKSFLNYSIIWMIMII